MNRLTRLISKAMKPKLVVPPMKKSPELKRLDKKVLKEKGEL